MEIWFARKGETIGFGVAETATTTAGGVVSETFGADGMAGVKLSDMSQ